MKARRGTKHPQYLLSDFFFSAGFSSHMHFGIGNQIGVPSALLPEILAFAAALASVDGLFVRFAIFFLAS